MPPWEEQSHGACLNVQSGDIVVNPMPDNENAIYNQQGVMYALPMLGFTFMIGPIMVVQGVYVKYFGLDLILLALILVWAKVFDAVTDPLVGYWSDRCRTRSGGRKPMVVIGSLLSIVSCYLLFVPVVKETHPGGGATVSTGYFIACYLWFYLATTIFEISHMTWGSELTRDVNQQRMVFGWRAFFSSVGAVLFYLLPFVPVFDSRAFTPATLEWAALIGGAMVLLCLSCSLGVPSGEIIQLPRRPAAVVGKNSPYQAAAQAVAMLFSNIPLRFLVGAVALMYVGVGMWLALTFLFVDVYLGLGEVLAGAYALTSAASAVAAYGWVRLARHLGNQRTWVAGLALGITTAALMSLLAPGSSPPWLLVTCMITFLVGVSSHGVIAPTILSAIVDYDTWKFGGQRTGTFFSVYAFVVKVSTVCGAALGFFITGIYGFDATANTHLAETAIGLRLGMTWLPIVFMGLAIPCVVLNPLNETRHAIIRRRLETVAKRHQRRGRTSPCLHKDIFTADIRPMG
jgi:glycoside/pentoside/hexuronide:cation symporter, GPH family